MVYCVEHTTDPLQLGSVVPRLYSGHAAAKALAADYRRRRPRMAVGVWKAKRFRRARTVQRLGYPCSWSSGQVGKVPFSYLAHTLSVFVFLTSITFRTEIGTADLPQRICAWRSRIVTSVALTACDGPSCLPVHSTVLPVPYAFSKTGILAGLLTMLVVAFANDRTCCMMIESAAATGLDTYEELAMFVGGPKAKVCMLDSTNKRQMHAHRVMQLCWRLAPAS